METDDNIKKYYLLCTTRMGDKRHLLQSDMVYTILTKKEARNFLQPVRTGFSAREFVIGGANGAKDIESREPIIIIS